MSELYELPDGWEWKKLIEIVRVGCEKGYKPNIIDSKVPFIGMQDIDKGKGRETKYILEEYEKVSKGKTKFQKDAILLGKITPCTQNNKTTIVPDSIEGGFATTEVYALHCLEQIKPLYLNYYVRSDKVNNFLVNSMIGATGRQRVPSDTVKYLNIPLPPLKEQKRIVSKLDTLFEKIDKAIELHEKNIKEANAFMGSVLNEVFEELEEKYEKKQLKDIVSLLGDGLHGTPKYDEMGEYYFINGSNLLNNRIAYKDNTKKVSKLEFDKYKKNLNDRTVLVSINGTVGNVGLYNNEKCILGKSACYFNLLSGIDKVYMTYVIRNGTFQRYIRENATGSTIMNISLKTMRAYNFVVPPIKTQQKTVKYLDEVSQKIEKTKAIQKEKLQNLKDLKASILDQAFKGQL